MGSEAIRVDLCELSVLERQQPGWLLRLAESLLARWLGEAEQLPELWAGSVRR